MSSLKLIITSKKNLELKYGSKFHVIQDLFRQLMEFDKSNGIKTELIFLDDTISAKKAGLPKAVPITERNCKAAFDKIYKKRQPDYMVIFGAEDVFPFQMLENELYTDDEADDPDSLIPSDLPYACEASYSTSVSAFTNPTRVVGRIPDLPVVADIRYVKKIISNIITHKQKSLGAYQNYFAVSAQEWINSSSRSIQNIFGHTGQLKSSPKARGRGYKKDLLKPLSHFYNCHGGLNDSQYYGQDGNDYPAALLASELNSKISKGTIVAAECCYGAQIFNPEDSENFDKSIASNYLFNNAVSFLGSSTVAYGPAEGQGLADLICQYFMINVHRGYSTGRALLEARQKFLTLLGPTLDPFEQKTVAQFHILGDPSLHPVQSILDKNSNDTRKNRRLKLLAHGLSLGKSITPSRKTTRKEPNLGSKEVTSILKQTGFRSSNHKQAYVIPSKKISSKNASNTLFSSNDVYFSIYTKGKKTNNPAIKNTKILVIKSNKKQVLGHRVYFSKWCI